MGSHVLKYKDVFLDLLGEKYVLSDFEQLEGYAKDETRDLGYLPELVLKPKNSTEISAILSVCHREGLTVTPRGGGSGVSGGAQPVEGGIVLCMERLNSICDVDQSNMTVTVETGVITQKVNEQLMEYGLWLPPDPGSAAFCQIGGNLSEMAAGPKSVKYGAFKDYVLNLQVVLPDGRITWTGANVRKLACGYNLTQLMLGSEGTLGIITRVVFKVVPLPKEEILVRLAFSSLNSACDMICKIFEVGLTPSELEFIDRDSIDAVSAVKKEVSTAVDVRSESGFEAAKEVSDNTEVLLWVGFDGSNRSLLLDDAEKVADLAQAYNVLEVFVAQEPAQKRRLWEYRHLIGKTIMEATVFRDIDLSFPRSALRDIIAGTKHIGEKYGLRTVCFGHCGDGNIHIQLLRDKLEEAEWDKLSTLAVTELYELTTAKGGAISGEHGIGCVATLGMPLMFSEVQLELMQGIKTLFDPKNILNPGKIIPNLSQ